MSNTPMPTLPGVRINVQRTVIAPPVAVKTTPSQREFRTRDAALPRYRYQLQFEFLRSTAAAQELQALVGHYNTHGGAFDSFPFKDPIDNAAVLQSFGTGNGLTVAFQLTRTLGGYAEPVFDLDGAPAIYKAGVLQSSGYTVSTTGLVTFSSAPTSGQALTWSGAFFRRVRYVGDLDPQRIFQHIWELRRLELLSVKD